MNLRHYFVGGFVTGFVRTGRASGLCLILVAGLVGCRHKATPFVLPQGAHAPIDLEMTDVSDAPSEIATLPAPELEPLPTPPSPPKPVPRRRPAPAPKEDTQPPVQIASEPEPAALAIGALSAGGDTTPQIKQQTQDLIASTIKRIAAMPAKIADAQKKQIRQVRNFLDKAQKALSSSDFEGANNLANKARLLMDDLEKR